MYRVNFVRQLYMESEIIRHKMEKNGLFNHDRIIFQTPLILRFLSDDCALHEKLWVTDSMET